MDKVRLKAAEIIMSVLEEGAFSGQALDKALSHEENLKDLDKSFITELVYGTINRLYSIDRIIENYSTLKFNKIEPFVLRVLRMTVYQIRYLDKVPSYAAINEGVELIKDRNPRAVSFANGVLRNILRDEKPMNFKSSIDKLSFTHSIPPWITESLMKDYPKNYKGILSSYSKNKGVTLRVNEKKITSEKYIEILRGKDIDFKESEVLKEFINLPNPGNIRKLPGYNDGYFSIQNESAGYVSFLLSKENPSEVLDICAAPGGKSAYLSELLKGKGQILALDIYPKRVELMKENFKRLGLNNIKAEVSDATVPRKDFIDRFDGIICDVPCSGFGLLGRKPDIKFNITEEAILEIRQLQKKILNNASLYLKKGGTMIYSTCTLNGEENEKAVDWFIKTHEDFYVEAIEPFTSSSIYKVEGGMLTVMPNNTLDGFFMARIKRR